MPEPILALFYLVIFGGVAWCFVYLYRTGDRPAGSARKASPAGAARSGSRGTEVTFQGPDFKLETYGALDAPRTAELFRSLPWGDDFRKFQEAESDGGEGCPPNLSVVVDGGRKRLQAVCTGPDLFWLELGSGEDRQQIDGLSPAQIEERIEAFFASEPAGPAA